MKFLFEEKMEGLPPPKLSDGIFGITVSSLGLFAISLAILYTILRVFKG
jgi:hypothetical protein